MSSLEEAEFVEGRIDLIRNLVHDVLKLAFAWQVLADIVHKVLDLRQILDRLGSQVELYGVIRDDVVTPLISLCPLVGKLYDCVVILTQCHMLSK